VIALEARGQRIQEPLADPHSPNSAAHVLEQQQPSAGPQHPAGLRDSKPNVGDRTQRQRRDDRVKVLVRKIQGLRVAQMEINGDVQLVGSPAGYGQHGWAELNGT
jgi:hypothetical protein